MFCFYFLQNSGFEKKVQFIVNHCLHHHMVHTAAATSSEARNAGMPSQDAVTSYRTQIVTAQRSCLGEWAG